VLIARGVSRPRARLLLAALVLSLFPFLLPAAPAHADFTAICNGYSGCKAAGYGNAGYAINGDTMYWRMYAGHNCTNYAAYRMVHAGMPNSRPWTGVGNAENWGHAMAYLTDDTPTVGSIAWMDAYQGYAGSAGHVAYVERVISSSEIIVSEDMWGGDFHWRRITKSGRGWPSGFIHFHDVALQNEVAPTVAGTPQVGQTLTADAGTWSSSPSTVSYQWFADGQLVSGATGQSWVVPAGRVGQQVSVQVAVAATGYASALATTARTGPVAPGVISQVAAPAVSGDPELGAVLTASKGTWAPGKTAKSIQWRSDGVDIPGATSWRLPLGRDEVGTRVTAVVTATRTGYQPATVATAPTPAVLGGPVKLTSPFSVSTPETRPPRVGDTLTVAPGTVDPSDATAAYTWLRDGQVVPGKTGDSYAVGPDDLGHQISVRVDLTRDGYKPLTVETEPTDPAHTVAAITLMEKPARPQRALVVVNLGAPGVDQVTGSVRVRVGGQVQTAELTGAGHARLVFAIPHRGTRTVVVRYAGDGDLVDAAPAVRSTVEVLPPRKPTKH